MCPCAIESFLLLLSGMHCETWRGDAQSSASGRSERGIRNIREFESPRVRSGGDGKVAWVAYRIV